MPERLIIGAGPGGARKYTSRARLITDTADRHPQHSPDFDRYATEIGQQLVKALSALDGIDFRFERHSVEVRLVHPKLWSWDEVEPGIIAAWAQVLGGQPEIIREGEA